MCASREEGRLPQAWQRPRLLVFLPTILLLHEGPGLPTQTTISPRSACGKGSGRALSPPPARLNDLFVNFASGGISLEVIFSSGMPGKRSMRGGEGIAWARWFPWNRCSAPGFAWPRGLPHRCPSETVCFGFLYVRGIPYDIHSCSSFSSFYHVFNTLPETFAKEREAEKPWGDTTLILKRQTCAHMGGSIQQGFF